MDVLDRLIADVAAGKPPGNIAVARAEWPSVAARCQDEGLAGSLYPFISQAPSLPPDVRDALRSHYEHAAMILALYTEVLGELAGRCGASGRVVIIQGLALAEYIYPEPLTRLVTDVDVFLPDGNVQAVRAELARMGFVRVGDYANVWTRNHVTIDLHEDLWGADRIPHRKLVAPVCATTYVPSARVVGCLVPEPGLLALHAAHHGLKHGLSRRIWVLDTLLLHRRGAFDASLRDDGRRICAPLLTHVLGAFGPDRLPPELRADALPIRQRWAARLLAMGRKEGIGELVLALLCKRPRSTVEYLWSTIMPPRRVLREMYGNAPMAVLRARRLSTLMRMAAKAVTA